DKDGKQFFQVGFPMTYPSKRALISLADQMLREQSVGLVSEHLVQQCCDVEWYTEGGLAKPLEGRRQHLAGAPERRDSHDDDWITLLLGLWALMAEDFGEQGYTEEDMAYGRG
ncbi:MAG: hypothetical protein ACREJC_20645, partial [Tepidisphaeraceae bacterium]